MNNVDVTSRLTKNAVYYFYLGDFVHLYSIDPPLMQIKRSVKFGIRKKTDGNNKIQK